MLEDRIKELEMELLAALESVAELTKINAGFRGELAQAELALRMSRCTVRPEGNVLRDELSTLEKR